MPLQVVDQISKKRKRHAYDASFKIRVATYAIENGNNSKAAREFDVSEKQVRDWKKNLPSLNELPRSKKACRGKTSPYLVLETQLNDWNLEQRQSGYIVSRGAIRMKAKSDFKASHPEFKASAGWCTRFMNRHNLSLRTRTKISQKLPRDLDDKITSFHSYIIDQRTNYDFPLSNIANMDETPMFFDLPSNRTVHPRGDHTILVKTTGHEKTHFTVVLACMADGTKLKPMVIFKRKTMPKEVFPSGVVVHVHEKGWMDTDGVLLWLQKVWAHRPGGMTNQKSMLVWDMFRSHLVPKVKARLQKGYNTTAAVIPGGLTSVLQPLDVSLNRPLKCHIRDQWITWMASGAAERTAGGNYKRPALGLVTQWVKTAWDKIDNPMIQKSFLKCGISNALDGTEDDVLWEENVQPNPQPDSDSDDDDMDAGNEYYDNLMTDADIQTLFAESDDSDFEGFE